MKYLLIVLMFALTGCESELSSTSQANFAAENSSVTSWFECAKAINTGIETTEITYKVVRFSNGDTFVRCGRPRSMDSYSDFITGSTGDSATCEILVSSGYATLTTVGASRTLHITPIVANASWVLDHSFSPSDCQEH